MKTKSNMKNIVCPVSDEKISENLPRITAFLVAAILIAYLFTGFLPLILILGFDFFMRGFNFSRFSPIFQIAKPLSQSVFITDIKIDKAPKLFAARLGGIMSIFIVVSHVLHFGTVAASFAILVGVLSTLECVLNFCVGCYVYSWLVLPVFQKAR